MMKFDLSPEWHLANGFADYVAAWADGLQAPEETRELLRQIARNVSLATIEGNVCASLSDMPFAKPSPDRHDMHELLYGSGVVGSPENPGTMPLILDADGRIYLHRYFAYESRLARRLIATQVMTTDSDATSVRQQLDTLFGLSDGTAPPDWQKIAAALALQQPLTIISGGPGTGKTTTVVNLLACLLEQHPDLEIALAAPTGKAAARMQEAIRRNMNHLAPALQARMPQTAQTIHRLLGVSPSDGNTRYHAKNPLPIDALIVDEASMLDLALAARLFDAVPRHARIILLGDKDQLSAVEAGAVFSELSADPSLTQGCVARLSASTGIAVGQIVAATPRAPSSLRDSVVWFSESYRFTSDSGIGKLAKQINDGASVETVDWLRTAGDPAVTWVEDGGKALSESSASILQDGYADYSLVVRSQPENPQAIFEAFERFRILCATREGRRGVEEINRMISHTFHQGAWPEWFPGRPVLILRNDYTLNLFNGDIGIALPAGSGQTERLMVYFPDGSDQFRAIAPARLPDHETAFAITVHKAQGSEFDAVLLLMPEQPMRVCSQELLYTAITRARREATIVASESVLKQTIETQIKRDSGLLRRMTEARRAPE